jgi:hypothetical protein
MRRRALRLQPTKYLTTMITAAAAKKPTRTFGIPVLPFVLMGSVLVAVG